MDSLAASPSVDGPLAELRPPIPRERSRGRSAWARHHRRWMAVGLIAIVALLVLEGVPAPAAAVVPPGPFPAPKTLPSAPSLAPTASPVASPTSTVLPSPTGESASPSVRQLASLCLLMVSPACARGGVARPAAIHPDLSGSSWTNVTNLAHPTPPERYLPSMVYSPFYGGDVLFGGYGSITGPPYWVFYNDTWVLKGSTWSELVSSTGCQPSTCPTPRAGSVLAQDGPNSLVLFGGYNYTPSITIRAFADTWLFSGGAWTNITATAGTGPSARYDAVMSYDSLDNLVLLFGGENANGTTLGDTWELVQNHWTNVTATVGSYLVNTAPSPRAGASMAASPDGHIMMFGGEDQGYIILNSCNNASYGGPEYDAIAWWWYGGHWLAQANYTDGTWGPCLPHTPVQATPLPTVGSFGSSSGPPCGRIEASLGWSNNNQRFVMYGGVGPQTQAIRGVCTGFVGFLNDTWVYRFPPGGGFNWTNITDPGDPPAREQMGYASDLSSGYFVIYGGYAGSYALNETWRFFELVHAKLTGPSDIDTSGAPSFLLPFVVDAYGGSSNLRYSFSLTSIRNGHTLSGPGNCSYLEDIGAPYTPPYSGYFSFTCLPTQLSYNVYRAKLTVVDFTNISDHATANWTFTVTPPEAMRIYSQYVQLFYTGFTIQNVFTVYAEVANSPAVSVSVTIGGDPKTFTQQSNPDDWNSPQINMGTVAPGSQVLATAQFGGWTLNASYSIYMVDTPTWLQSMFTYTGASSKVTPSGAGPYNKTYSISETYNWNIGKIFNFSIPVPLVSGNYGLIPSIAVTLGATSQGNVSLSGTFTLSTPTIALGPFSLTISASVTLKGTFALGLDGSNIETIDWLGASVTLTVTGSFSASVPIYGFSFNLFGDQINVGFTLQITIAPSIALSFLMAPTQDTTKQIIGNIGVMLTKILGSFTLPLTAAVNFGIGIASVSFGGTLSVALEMELDPVLKLADGWVNGSIQVGAQFLFWSGSFNLIGPGVIYSWDPPPAVPPALPAARPSTSYNDGANATWVVHARYYTGTGYDAPVWNGTATEGPAISDVYPGTALSAAPASSGAYLFYTDDNVSVPVTQGLTVSGLRLDPATDHLTSIPSPRDPGFVIARPQATTLPDGDLYVAWNALPMAETTLAGPQAVTSLALHGAVYDPSTGLWGAVRDFPSGGIVQSFALAPAGANGRAVALVAPAPGIGTTTPERLVQYDLGSGAVVSNASVTGLSEVVSVGGGPGWAVVRDLGGNDSVVALASGQTVSVPFTPSSGYDLLSERFETGGLANLVQLYRGPDASEVALVNLSTGATIATQAIDGNAADVQAVAAGSTHFVFVQTPAGLLGWKFAGGTWTNVTAVAEPGIVAFGVVQSGSSLLLYSVARTGGNASQPIEAIDLAEVGASLTPLPSPSAPSSTGTSPLGTTTLTIVLVVVAVADAVLLAVWVFRRRRPPTALGAVPPSPESSPASSTTAGSAPSPPEPPVAPPPEPTPPGAP
jgi:hypothetical protein